MADVAAAGRVLRRDGPTDEAVQRLHRGWSNRGFAATPELLREVGERARGATAVLECGSGATSLLLGALGAPTWTLEHEPRWAQRVARHLRLVRGGSVRLQVAPLVPVGRADWYPVPDDLPARLDLVVCDGPPAATRGGRAGLVEAVGERLHGATIIVDDAARPGESGLVDQLVGLGWTAELHDLDRRSFVVLVPAPGG